MANCQKCGAELPPGTTTCEYCGSVAEPPRSPSGEEGVQRPRAPQAGETSQGDVIRFKRRSILGMVLCTLFTMGLYISIWCWLRRESLMMLDPAQSKRTDQLVKGLVGVHIFYFFALFTPDLQDVAGLLSMCFIGMEIYISFTVRGLLRGYAERVSPRSPANALIASSAVLTFLFGIFYLQGQINRMIDVRLLEAKL